MYTPFEIAVAGALMMAAASSDVARHRIPNVLVVAVAVAGLVAQWRGGGPSGIASGLAASVAIAGLLLPVWTTGRLGGGDLKLAAAGAVWAGLGGAPRYVAASAILGGLLAFACYCRSPRAARTSIRANLFRGYVPVFAGPLAVPGARPLVPYGVAFAASTMLVICRGVTT